MKAMKNISFNAVLAVLQTTLVETLVLSPNELLFAEVLKILTTLATPPLFFFFRISYYFGLPWGLPMVSGGISGLARVKGNSV